MRAEVFDEHVRGDGIVIRQPIASGLQLMSVELGGEAEDFLQIELAGGVRAAKHVHERGVVLDLEAFDAKGVAALLGGFREWSLVLKTSFFFASST